MRAERAADRNAGADDISSALPHAGACRHHAVSRRSRQDRFRDAAMRDDFSADISAAAAQKSDICTLLYGTFRPRLNDAS